MDIHELRYKIEDYLQFFVNEKINLKYYAEKNHIPIYVNGNMDKGWKGNVVEHILNLKKNNKKGADYLGLEIKTVPILIKKNEIKVKETTCLSVLDTNEIIKDQFEQSSLFEKINNTLFVLINVEDDDYPYIIGTYHLNLNSEQHQILKEKMKQDFELISSHIFDNIENELPLDHNFTGKLGEIIQPRPKTGKKGSYTWAFYLKTTVLNELLNIKSLEINQQLKI